VGEGTGRSDEEGLDWEVRDGTEEIYRNMLTGEAEYEVLT